MEQKYLLKRLVGEMYEIRTERRKVGSVRLITSESSPNKGKYIANLNSVSAPVYADTKEAALDAILALRVTKTKANVQLAIEQRQVLLQRRMHSRPRMKPVVADTDALLGPIKSVRIAPRRKDTTTS